MLYFVVIWYISPRFGILYQEKIWQPWLRDAAWPNQNQSYPRVARQSVSRVARQSGHNLAWQVFVACVNRPQARPALGCATLKCNTLASLNIAEVFFLNFFVAFSSKQENCEWKLFYPGKTTKTKKKSFIVFGAWGEIHFYLFSHVIGKSDWFFKKYFWAFLLSNYIQCILSFYISTAMYYDLKTLTPRQDLNLGSSVLEANAMTTMPRKGNSDWSIIPQLDRTEVLATMEFRPIILGPCQSLDRCRVTWCVCKKSDPKCCPAQSIFCEN
jgi:hypothetical protein